MNLYQDRIKFLILTCIAVSVLAFYVFSHKFIFVWDDYRYLALIKSGLTGILGGIVVENRWDHSWWISEGTYIRFLRPFVIISYWFDFWIDDLNVNQYILSNFLLHLIATFFGFRLLRHFIPEKASFLASIIFLLHGAHFENLAYIAGRTDTIAAIFAFGTLCSYIKSLQCNSFRISPLLWFLFALIAKEYNVLLILAISLINLHLFQGLTKDSKKLQMKFLSGFVIVLLIYFASSSVFLGERGGYFFPYFFSPLSEGFFSRTLTMIISYSASLILGSFVPPFLNSWDQLTSMVALWEIYLTSFFVALFLFLGITKRSTLIFIGLTLLFLAPLIPLYSTSRYLYIPSLFFCGFLALIFSQSSSFLVKNILIIPIILPTLFLFGNLNLMGTRIDEPKTVYEKLAPFLDNSSNKPIFIINFPYSWIADQFINDTLSVLSLRDEGNPKVSILNRDSLFKVTKINKIDTHTLEVSIIKTDNQNLSSKYSRFLPEFKPRSFSTNQKIIRSDYEVDITETSNSFPTKIFFKFNKQINTLIFLEYTGAEIREVIL